jgi:hypothetical protein
VSVEMGANLLQIFQLANKDFSLKGSVYSDTYGFFHRKAFQRTFIIIYFKINCSIKFLIKASRK